MLLRKLVLKNSITAKLTTSVGFQESPRKFIIHTFFLDLWLVHLWISFHFADLLSTNLPVFWVPALEPKATLVVTLQQLGPATGNLNIHSTGHPNCSCHAIFWWLRGTLWSRWVHTSWLHFPNTCLPPSQEAQKSNFLGIQCRDRSLVHIGSHFRCNWCHPVYC